MYKLTRRLSILLLATSVTLSHLAQAGPNPAADSSGFNTITSEQLFELAQTDIDLKVLDLRLRFEFNRGHLPEAINLPNNEADATSLQRKIPDKQNSLLIYCGSEQCENAKRLASMAVTLGYQQVFWYRGGINSWINEGYLAEQESVYETHLHCSYQASGQT